jgi:hypothetical protein
VSRQDTEGIHEMSGLLVWQPISEQLSAKFDWPFQKSRYTGGQKWALHLKLFTLKGSIEVQKLCDP